MNTLSQPISQQVIDALINLPFNKLLGLRLEEISSNEVSLHFPMQPQLIGNYLQGILHGGVISSVLDMTGGMVIMAHALSKHIDASLEELMLLIGSCSTVSLQINYLRPGKGNAFIAKGCIVKSGKKISFANMELYNQEQTLIASGTGTYLIARSLA
jgi:uncharacterized protein (TIGR00369 family)